jgi:tetratricopeptide (TPR) repeat protein
MNFKVMRRFVVILIVSVCAGASLNAQVVRNDVIKAYNEGVNAMKTDTPTAIKAFENTIVLADQLGQEGTDLKDKAIKVLPGLYANLANTALKDKKPAAEVIRLAKTAAAVAEKYGNTTAKDNSKKILIQGYNSLASGFFSQSDFKNALVTFDSILTINPGYNAAIYNKALIYMKQDSAASFEKTIDFYIGKLKGDNDTVKVVSVSKQALEYFRLAGSKANQAGKLDDAIVLLDKAAKYGDDKDLFYYYADVYNKQKNFDNGAIYAQKGLDLETGEAIAKAKFYYQLGLAQMGKGLTAEACASFKNSMYGDFVVASKANRTNLKCE